VCYAFSQLAAGFKDSDTASPLSPYFKEIVQALLETVRHSSGLATAEAGAGFAGAEFAKVVTA